MSATRHRGRVTDPKPKPHLLRVLSDGHEVWMRDKTMFVIPPAPPEDAPLSLREGLARRRIATLTERCPCGARRGRPWLGEDGYQHASFWHEDGCPAGDERLGDAYDAWKAAR